MRKNNISYPYPVLRAEPVDFKSGHFVIQYNLETTRAGYTLTVDFNVNDPYSQNLIKEGKIKYAVHVLCRDTLLRKMYKSDASKQVISIKAEDVHGAVFVRGYLIAESEITNYSNPDFAEGYKGFSFTLHQGDIIGIGERWRFDAVFEEEIITNAASIMRIEEDNSIKYMETDLENDHIIIKLPPEQVEIYRSLQFDKTKWDITHAAIVVPVLVEVIAVMNQERKAQDEYESGYCAYPWFRTISRNITEVAGKLKMQEDELYEHPCRTAQILMKNNSAKVLNLISEGGD